MKLLTLEEIEQIEKLRAEMIELEPEPCELGVWQVEMSRFNQYQLPNLLATARAYWELEKAAAIHLEVMKDIKKEDKPHAPTIKAIVEWLSADRYNRGFDDLSSQELIKRIESNLESILKEL